MRARLPCAARRWIIFWLGMSVLCAAMLTSGWAQGPTPETGATLFPGGAFVSYGSVFTTRQAPTISPGSIPIPTTARPTFLHQASLTFAWGVRRDLTLTAVVPVLTTGFDVLATNAAGRSGGTGLGDTLVLLKYRFLRVDSERGTTQASITIGPKLPTGRTNLRDAAGARLPAGLQPGSGSTDLFLGLSGTYTGLFHIKKLVADESLQYIARTQGSQQMQFGNSLESRFWLSYRPYQEPAVGKEWFIGPSLAWLHRDDDREAGIAQATTGGDVLLFGPTTYVGLRAGLTVWFAADFPVAQSAGGSRGQMKRRFSFGITQQFRLRK